MSDAFVDALRTSLRGEVIAEGDGSYDSARAVYNGMIHKRPRAIARVADAADVITCVKAAREERLALAIRGGGHNAGGLGVVDGGLCVDFGRLRGTRVDPKARTVRVEA